MPLITKINKPEEFNAVTLTGLTFRYIGRVESPTMQLFLINMFEFILDNLKNAGIIE